MGTPDLNCPIESVINPHHDRADEESMHWAVEHELIPIGGLPRLSSLRLSELVCRAYPYAEYDDLRVLLDWTLWRYLVDDAPESLGERRALFEGDEEHLRAQYLDYVDVIENGDTGGEIGLRSALGDLRERMLERSHPGCVRRFSEACVELLDAMSWETLNRVNGTPPSPRSYLQMREYTVGLYPSCALFDVSHQTVTTDSLWTDPDVRRLLTSSANVVGWANDVFSYKKERVAGDPHNLVLLLSAERGLSFEDAVDEVVEMHDLELRRFLDLEHSVRARRSREQDTLNRLLDMLRAWIRGNLDWSTVTSRFDAPAMLEGGVSLKRQVG